MNTTKRTHVIVPTELIEEIDKLSGKRKRSWFITCAIRKEIQRMKFLNAVKETAAVWDEKDHPKFKDGLDKWVEKIRQESEDRLKE